MKWDPSATKAQIKGAAESGEVVPTSESVLEMRLLWALAFKFYFLTGFCLSYLFSMRQGEGERGTSCGCLEM